MYAVPHVLVNERVAYNFTVQAAERRTNRNMYDLSGIVVYLLVIAAYLR
jgi:hypothetical protein